MLSCFCCRCTSSAWDALNSHTWAAIFPFTFAISLELYVIVNNTCFQGDIVFGSLIQHVHQESRLLRKSRSQNTREGYTSFSGKFFSCKWGVPLNCETYCSLNVRGCSAAIIKCYVPYCSSKNCTLGPIARCMVCWVEYHISVYPPSALKAS